MPKTSQQTLLTLFNSIICNTIKSQFITKCLSFLFAIFRLTWSSFVLFRFMLLLLYQKHGLFRSYSHTKTFFNDFFAFGILRICVLHQPFLFHMYTQNVCYARRFIERFFCYIFRLLCFWLMFLWSLLVFRFRLCAANDNDKMNHLLYHFYTTNSPIYRKFLSLGDENVFYMGIIWRREKYGREDWWICSRNE